MRIPIEKMVEQKRNTVFNMIISSTEFAVSEVASNDSAKSEDLLLDATMLLSMII